MATNYPSSLDSLTNPTGTDTLDSATVPHASQHANANDAIEAIEATLGTNPQGSSATVKDRFGTVASLASVNAFTVGGHTITNNSDVVPLILKANVTQTANMLELRNDGGTPTQILTAAGTIRAAANITAGTVVAGLSVGLLNSLPRSASEIGLFVKGFSAQTGDLAQYTNSTPTVLGGRNALGQIYSGSTSSPNYSTGGATTAASGDGATATITTTTATNLAVGDLIVVNAIEPIGYRTTGAVVTAVSNTSPFTVSYANTTTGSQVTPGTVRTTAQTAITPRSNATKGLTIRATSGQTANLQEWQNSTGDPVSSISASGSAFFSTSQSSNFVTSNNLASISEVNSGGSIQIKKSSNSSFPGTTDFARICLVDGTTAGTLKLVIRAGTSGAQTTILDNIPQS